MLTALLALMLASCATYTIQDGYDSINLPEVQEKKTETRYRLIKQSVPAEIVFTEQESTETAEDETMAAENEAPAEEEISIPVSDETVISETEAVVIEEEAAQEEAVETVRDVNMYPENLRDISYPHVYLPLHSSTLKSGDVITARVLLLPLGYDDLEDADINRIVLSVGDTDADFIILTGSLANQVRGAVAAGLDAVTLRGGTILYSSRLDRVNNAESAVFTIADGKDLGIAPVSYRSQLPESSSGIAEWISEIRRGEEEAAAEIIGIADDITDSERIIALSSPTPATRDWMDFTPYPYRHSANFAIADRLEEEGWTDTYDATHFSAETDSGVTRISGDVYERMDFIYIKGMMPGSALSFPVAGLTDTTGHLGLMAEIIIP